MTATSANEMLILDHQRLSCHPLKQLLQCGDKDRLLLLVNVADDDNIFGGKAAEVNETQRNEIVFISSR